MKFIKTLIVALLLTGCTLLNQTTTTKTETTTNTTTSTTEGTTSPTEGTTTTTVGTTTTENLPFLSKKGDLVINDIAPEYLVDAETLAVYRYKHDSKISYVNIIDFINILDGAIIDLEINKTDQLILTYTFEVPVEYQDLYGGATYTYEMIINADQNTIKLKDFDMLSSLNVDPLTEYETDLEAIDFEIIDGNYEVEIDLSEYNFDIVLYEGDYYLPLYLANLFFSGSYINVYEMNDELFIFDSYTDIEELESQYEKDFDLIASEIRDDTENYLALYFDYFYGLKDFKNIDTFRDIIDDYNFANVSTFSSLHKEIEKFLNAQNDLHTSILSTGYMNRSFIPSSNINQKYRGFANAYFNNSCSTRTNEVITKNNNNTLLIEINEFTLDTRDLLIPVMEEAQNYDNIIIDMSCNSGGNLIAVIELLSYMTNERIPITYLNPVTGSITTEYYQASNNIALENKDFYVFTTAFTFSAANLFTSIVKDMELGIIFGEDSSGGASAITYTVLPDGSIIVNSSNMTLLNKSHVIIEDGIPVDVTFEYPFTWYEFNNTFLNNDN